MTSISTVFCVRTTRPLAVATLSMACLSATGQETSAASLSVGALKGKAEEAAVRLLVKFGDSLSVTDRLIPKSTSGDRGEFYTLNRTAKIDATDNGQFGGVSVRYGVKYYNVGMKSEIFDGKPIIKFDGDKWMHVIPVSLGVDADRGFKNRDTLLEVGYIPALFKGTDSCFKIGANPIIGAALQVGHRKRVQESTETGKPPESSGSLRRLKVEGKFDFALSCVFRLPGASTETSGDSAARVLLGDIGRWQITLSSAAWRDFSEDRNYRRTELNVRIPTSAKTYVDFKREVGAAPAEYNTGAKYSANLTVEF